MLGAMEAQRPFQTRSIDLKSVHHVADSCLSLCTILWQSTWFPSAVTRLWYVQEIECLLRLEMRSLEP